MDRRDVQNVEVDSIRRRNAGGARRPGSILRQRPPRCVVRNRPEAQVGPALPIVESQRLGATLPERIQRGYVKYDRRDAAHATTRKSERADAFRKAMAFADLQIHKRCRTDRSIHRSEKYDRQKHIRDVISKVVKALVAGLTRPSVTRPPLASKPSASELCEM